MLMDLQPSPTWTVSVVIAIAEAWYPVRCLFLRPAASNPGAERLDAAPGYSLLIITRTATG